MLNIEKNKCCGCEVCEAVCPTDAIKMQYDEEGFSIPKIDPEKCIHCDLCDRVCPFLNWKDIKISSHNTYCYAGYTTDEEILKKSSSGGIATALALAIVKKGGSVFGVEYTDDFKSVQYTEVTNEEQICRIRGTKYIESRKGELYFLIAKRLKEKKDVLVIGLPCDIAAVKKYFRDKEGNLYTCELICHGPTSEKAQRDFVDTLEKRFQSKIIDFNVRYKKEGWTPLYLRVRFANGKIYENRFNQTDLFSAFAILIRPSCYNCVYKGDSRVADITIGDFWGDIEEEPYWNRDGVSAIMVHTESGRNLLDRIEDFKLFPVDYERIVKANPRLNDCEITNPKRNLFSECFTSIGLWWACVRTQNIKRTIKLYYYILKEGWWRG